MRTYDAVLDYFKLNEPKTWRDRVQNTAPPKPTLDSIDNIKQYCEQELPKIKPEHRHGVSYLASLKATYKKTSEVEESLSSTRRIEKNAQK
jgi:hypothetical protein